MAVALARKARFLMPEGTSSLYDVMAAAYATSGKRENAIRYQQLAIETMADQSALGDRTARLRLFEAGEIFLDETSNRFLPGSS